MPESANVELAHKLTEQEPDEHHGAPPRRWHRLVEFGEVAILAIVAVATAWSGFQATEWDGQQSLLYGQASRDRFAAEAASTFAGQELSADSAMFTAWLQAHSAGNVALEEEMTRRFTPDYRTAFDAWIALDPFDNAAAPPGPAAMPEYHNPHRAEADKLNAEASRRFDKGNEARDGQQVRARHRPVRVGALPGCRRPTIQGSFGSVERERHRRAGAHLRGRVGGRPAAYLSSPLRGRSTRRVAHPRREARSCVTVRPCRAGSRRGR